MALRHAVLILKDDSILIILAEAADWPDYVVGTPESVRRIIERMAAETGATEFMIQDFLDDPDLRLRNYTLLAQDWIG